MVENELTTLENEALVKFSRIFIQVSHHKNIDFRIDFLFHMSIFRETIDFSLILDLAFTVYVAKVKIEPSNY